MADELLSNDPKTLQDQLRDMEQNPRDLFVLTAGIKHFSAGVTLRYMLLFRSGRNSLSYVGARQGRHTHATLAAAESFLDAMRSNNSADKLALYGGAKSLFVGFVACYGGHYDPAPIDLGSSTRYPANLDNLQTINRLSEAIMRCRRDYPH